jgi:MFS transporter, NNP family, nitrate/nitrite transporter
MMMNKKNNNGPIPFNAQILPLFLLTFIFFLNFTIRIIISPLLPGISEDMNLTQDQAGSFFLISASGYCIALLCSGFVSSAFLHKKTILIAAVGSGIALIAAGLSPNPFIMRLMIFFVGMCAALYIPSGMAVLTTSISNRHLGKAIGIHELAPNLSFLLVPVICEGLLLFISWRSVLVCVGMTSVIMGLCSYRFLSFQDFKGTPPMFKSFLPLMTNPSFWIMIALFSVGVAGTLGVYSMLPLYLVKEHGMLQAEANTLLTLSRISTLIMPFAAGWLSDRLGVKPILICIFLITGISTLLIGKFSGTFLKTIIFVQPIFAVSFFPPAFAALSRIGPKESGNIIVSFTIPVAFLVGGGVIPKLIGIAGDNDLFSLGFILTGLFIVSGIFLLLLLRLREE